MKQTFGGAICILLLTAFVGWLIAGAYVIVTHIGDDPLHLTTLEAWLAAPTAIVALWALWAAMFA